MELLILEVGSTAHWRAEKAEEYPDDERNAVAAKELEELEKALEDLPSDDPRFEAIEKIQDVLVDDDMYPGEELNSYISRTGFDQPADVESFLSGYVGILLDALNDDTGNAKKAWENRLRRAVDRQGYILRKSKVRDSYAPTHGLYWLIDPKTNTVAIHGPHTDGALDILDIETWIKTPEGEQLKWC